MPRRDASLILALSLALPVAAATSSPSYAQRVSLRVAGTVFGETAAIEGRDLSRETGAGALNSAWTALVDAEAELRRVVEQATGQPLAMTPEVTRLLVRTQSFCRWSDGATSALGAPVYKLWNAGSAALPTTAGLETAVDATRCGRMTVDEKSALVEILPGSALDLRSFARGWAIDRAADTLKGLGVSDFEVQIGSLTRAAGPGPGGRGWPYPLPTFARSTETLGTLLLRDQSVAIADPADRPMRIAGETFSRYIDLRSGRPSTGVAGVVVVSELAVDAEPLATAMAVFGANNGQMRLGTLKPKPAVLWLLGSQEAGAPVLASANWSAVKKQ